MSNLSEFELRSLLAQFKKSTEVWLLTGSQLQGADVVCDDASLDQVEASCVQILLHGLQQRMVGVGGEDEATEALPSSPTSTLPKLIEDFEWVRRSAQIRDSLPMDVTASAENFAPHLFQSAEHFLRSWTVRNLRARCLCACLEALVADKELLEVHYQEFAFLRSDAHATALFICLSALELNQCSLLSQIAKDLYTASALGSTKHKRASSHPNFSLSPAKETALKPTQALKVLRNKPTAPTVFPTFRKTKSLPTMPHTSNENNQNECASLPRPRSKTCNSSTRTQPKRIPNASLLCTTTRSTADTTSNTTAAAAHAHSDDDMQPSTSAGSKRSQTSNLTINSSQSSTSTVASCASSPANSTTTARPIELIKCDDIKIWTDQSWEHKQNESSQGRTAACAIPQHALPLKQSKSTSPINSFISSLFGTPPTYTSWSLSCQSSDAAAASAADSITVTTAAAAIYPCHASSAQENCGGGVFDAFLPVYGKKLRSRKSQNLFEDGISSLDYSAAAANELSPASQASTSSAPASSTSNNVPSASAAQRSNCQSLTAFLQMAQSRNNTELEKENAHFRISEAIISAIEHIKWAKMEPNKWRRENETSVATDWLEKDDHHKSCLKTETESPLTADAVEEHITYAEIGESCLDLLSAEVVGLSLISKFNDKHLPKMSELKWLVSEEDAPQQMLPMPDNTGSANPDDHVVRSVTRGTNYWAPPRQQIIFTDHPPPNRKELIKRQNNRCAGCGMRVSPQFVHSFRYCTYLGKYHCTGCHRQQISATPAKILDMWDFKCYPVSVFAYRLLEQMYTYPLFYVPDLNPTLYVRQKTLLTARQKRIQLKYVKDFIRTCRFATREQSYFTTIPDYITGDPDTWSMSDFIDARNKSLQRSIDELIERCENHIFNCVLCTARGFRCEYCLKDQVIYPWQNKISRCDRCGSCVHQNCWKLMAELCCRCQRINKRQVVDVDEI